MNTRDWARQSIFMLPILAIAAMGAIDLLALTAMALDWLYRAHRLPILLLVFAAALLIAWIVLLVHAQRVRGYTSIHVVRAVMPLLVAFACWLGAVVLLITWTVLHLLGM